MAEERTQRHLAAILAADVVGYSRLMEQDEADTHARLTAHLKELIEPAVEGHRGRIFKMMGDGLLAEFASVIDAVECAIAIQRGLAEQNSSTPDERRIELRIGINLGDVIVEEEDRYGEGVIIAARLQGLADPSGVFLSRQAYDQVETKLGVDFEDLGEHHVKNIVKPVRVYRLVDQPGQARPRRPGKRRQYLAVSAIVAVTAVVIVGAALRFWPASGDDLPPLPSGPKIAIIPFTSLGGDDDDAQLAAGLTEDIAATLSRFSDLFVFSLNATDQYKGQSVDPRRIKEELGARYVLEGSVRRSKTTLRVVAKLLDARDAQRLWSQTYDRDLTATDIFAVLDEVTEGVVATIGSSNGVIRLKEAQLVRGRRTESLEAYECVALTAWFATKLSQEARTTVRTCLERTVKFSPNYSKAWSSLADILIETYKNETFSEADGRDLLERADAAAKRAIELDNSDELAYYRRAIISRLRGESYETFKALADKALAVNPNNGSVVGDIGNFSYYSGDLERGKALVARMIKINPLYPSWGNYPPDRMSFRC